MSSKVVNKFKIILVLVVIAFSTLWCGISSLAKAEFFDINDVTLSMQTGATILTEEVDGKDGIAFKAELSVSEYEGILSLVDGGTYVEMETGLIIAPIYYNDTLDICVDSLFGENKSYDWAVYENGEWVYEESDKIRVINIYTNDWKLEDGVYTYSGGIVDILDENQDEIFYSTAYIKLTDIAGVDIFIFANSTYYDPNPVTGNTNLEFSLNEDGKSYSVVGMGECTSTYITIPKRYNGLPVTAIGDYAFNQEITLKGITIPEGIKTIGARAFGQCRYITDITIPDSVVSIGGGAFYYCVDLKTINISENSQLQYIGSEAFYYCQQLTNIRIPDGITSINSGTFLECNALKSLSLPSSLTSIAGKAFYGAGINYMLIPRNVTSIGSQAFFNCELDTVRIPSSVTYVGSLAFNLCNVYCEATSKPSGWDSRWKSNCNVYWGQ